MKNNGYKPRVPDIMEAVFDIGYLLFDLIAAVWQQRQNKKAAGYGVADFLCHDDRFLHSADVYLEKYIPGNANSRRIGNHHLGIRIGAYYRMSAAPKPLVLG